MFGLEYIIVFGWAIVKAFSYFFYWLATGLFSLVVIKFSNGRPIRRIGCGLVAFLILNIPPVVYPAYTYYQFVSLCSTENYYNIYKTVELEPEHWDEKGRARFFKFRAAADDTYVANGTTYRADDLSSNNGSAIKIYKVEVYSENPKNKHFNYSKLTWWPREFPGLSFMYRTLMHLSCKGTEGADFPSIYEVRNMVFIKGLNNE